MNRTPRVLAIAGSDSGGGAGVQADIKTLTAFGVYAATAITAVTVQDTRGVRAIHPTPPRLIGDQIRVVLADIGADAIKTGMIGGPDAFEAVLEALAEWPDIPRVIDPVMTAKGGQALVFDAGIDALRRLLAGAALVTPNAPEAEALTGVAVRSLDGQRAAAEKLLEAGARAALVKGGHLPGRTVVDVLVTPAGETLFEGPRFDSVHTHGTGCTLASACAAGLARGLPLARAVADAWAFTADAIVHAPGLGSGAGPIDHLRPRRS
jgi:hydroxymethylpyrimidine/phosphomethylpyrimidine kinase